MGTRLLSSCPMRPWSSIRASMSSPRSQGRRRSRTQRYGRGTLARIHVVGSSYPCPFSAPEAHRFAVGIPRLDLIETLSRQDAVAEWNDEIEHAGYPSAEGAGDGFCCGDE